MKSGFIAIIGKPNAGKSTLINTILNKVIAITTYKAQTTRNSIQGILNGDDYQIIFIDTPGIHEAKNFLGSYMNKEAYAQADGADIIFYLVDVLKGLDKDDEAILKKIFSYHIPVFCLFNKIDQINKDKLIERCNYANKHYSFDEIIPISAQNKLNIKELLKTCTKYLNEGPLYYPVEQNEVSSIEFKISEIIREKIILYISKEVPHYTAIKIEDFKNFENKVFISATIIINKESHKGIIIGKQGSMLKKINTASCKDIKKLLGKKVFLDLFVKVEDDWLNKSKKLFELGYFNEG